MSETLEQGDIYFFYRPQVNTDKVKGLKDIQNLYITLVPDEAKKARLFIVGKKRLPKITKGKSKSSAREWMLNDMTAVPNSIGKSLRAKTYATKTRGTQQQGEAIPVGEGRYALVRRDDSSRLAYRLVSPGTPGKAQETFGILEEASFVISVKNPSLDTPGFPDDQPKYPKKLQSKFADRRWIDVDDGALLNYKHAQLLLIGAHDSLAEEKVKIPGKPTLFKTLGLKHQDWPTDALRNGQLADPQM